MHKHAVSLVGLAVAASFLTAACSKDEEAQDPSDVPPGGYQQPYGQQPYGQPAPTYQQPAPAAPAANPLALPCQSDGGICGTHKCNLQTQKCSLPCAGPQDCMAGTTCMAGLCIPGGT